MADHKQSVDLIIANGDLFTGDRARPHFHPGAVAVRDRVIAAVGAERDVLSGFEAARMIDARGAPVHPGFIETHLHFLSVLFHGFPMYADARSTAKVSYAQVKTESGDPDAVSAFAAATVVALLRRGFTCFVEAGTVFETDALADMVTRCGTRALVSAPFGWDRPLASVERTYGGASRALLDRAPADAGRVIDRCRRELRRNEDENALVRGFVCLFGEGSGSDDLIRAGVALAREHGVIFNQHQAYHPDFVRAEQAEYGQSGVSRLDRLGALGAGTTLTHLNVVSPEDAERLMAAKPAVIWCPSNAMLRAIHPANRCHQPRFYRAGMTVSLAMDTMQLQPLGSAGLAGMLLSALIGERLADADPFYMHTMDAAAAIGLADRLGSLSVGKRADIVIRSATDITHATADESGSVLALSSSVMPVHTVLVDGRLVMQDGWVMAIDQEQVMASALHHRERLIHATTSDCRRDARPFGVGSQRHAGPIS